MPDINHRPVFDPLSYQGVLNHALIKHELEQVIQCIHQQMNHAPVPDDVHRLLEQGLTLPGKLLRPAMVLLAGHTCDAVTPDHITTAAVMEMIHAVTLFHDDVIDQGHLRRGRATINIQWGNAAAVLLGDWVLAQVLRVCVDLPQPVRRLIADMAIRICQGELRQTLRQKDQTLQETEYLDIIREKSASFFEGCCRAGAMLTTDDETRIGALAAYGHNMGMAFQLTDDLLDLCGQEEQTGKAVGNDMHNQHITLGIIHLLQHVDKHTRAQLIQQRDQGTITSDSLQALLSEYGSITYVRDYVCRYIQKAVATLGSMGHTEAGGILIDTANWLDGRSK